MKNPNMKAAKVKIAGKSHWALVNHGVHKGGGYGFSHKYGKSISPVGGGGYGKPKSTKGREFVIIVQGGGMGKPTDIKKIFKSIKK